MDEKLSEHFWLSEFLRSETAERRGIPNVPDDWQLANLRRNAAGMELVRGALGDLIDQPVQIHISSGLRVLVLNRLIGSKDTSAHIDGRATDFTAPAFGSPAEVCQAIEESDIAFDQLIHEHTWVHIAWPQAGNTPRREVLTLMPGNTYARGIIEKETA